MNEGDRSTKPAVCSLRLAQIHVGHLCQTRLFQTLHFNEKGASVNADQTTKWDEFILTRLDLGRFTKRSKSIRIGPRKRSRKMHSFPKTIPSILRTAREHVTGRSFPIWFRSTRWWWPLAWCGCTAATSCRSCRLRKKTSHVTAFWTNRRAALLNGSRWMGELRFDKDWLRIETITKKYSLRLRCTILATGKRSQTRAGKNKQGEW